MEIKKESGGKMQFVGERMIPGECDWELETEHLDRYLFARQFVEGKRVLDAACGVGYGSSLLAQDAVAVTGVDISKEAIQYANDNYIENNVRFLQASVEKLPFEDNSFDVVVSFETIEHVDLKVQHAFICEINRVLADDGILIISTPNHEIYQKRGENHFHVHELTFREWQTQLREKFQNVRFFSQQWEICDTIVGEYNSDAQQKNELNVATAEYLLAVCSNGELPFIQAQISVHNANKYKSLMKWAIENHNQNEKNISLIEQLSSKVAQLSGSERDLQKQVELLQKAKRDLLIQSDGLLTESERLTAENENIAAQLRQLQQTSQHWEARSHALENQNKELTVELNNKKGHIELLLVSDRELERIHKSRSWRFMSILWKIRDIVLPPNSRRWLLLKLMLYFFRNPIAFFKKINSRRIEHLVRAMGGRNVSDTMERINECFGELMIQTDPVVRISEVPRTPQEPTAENMAKYEHFAVPTSDSPLVSIVIPVYNQFHYTYACLKSIAQNSGNIAYEILIANDCSTDLTVNLEQIIDGVKVITNEKNFRFLLNCNHAAKEAKGKYILLLNNDTQVQPNWLQPLVDLIESDAKIGMVGSKLVYPDGRLQEAGGILWKDGSAWNYGHGKDPNQPEFSYVKEADYISGASIMIRTKLWYQIGGFDERFVPAYYEDTDLAFEVRNHGYKVMFQPKSVVVHFEGVSNGTDVTTEQKKFQVINAEKFYQKWKKELTNNHFPNAENVFLAKDRGQTKKHILVIDHYVPNFDKDAGGRCTFMYLQMFVKMGLKVTFIGDNFAQPQPYTDILTQMGIEVLYGNYYRSNYKKWLADNLKYFDYIYLQRPHISIKYIDIVKKYGRGKIFYFAHDLHHIRMMRDYEITGDKNALKEAKRWKEIEMELFAKADVGHVVGSYEQEIMQKVFPDKPIRNIPIYIYDEEARGVEKDFAKRKDILFVGGFGHTPNVDAVLWFAEKIFPKLLGKYPDLVWHIVGSKAPEEILRLASKHIILEGFVSDEELEKLYNHCRLVVAPLRYGAGVKGKIIESAYHQIPAVTTSIGGEGIDASVKSFVMADDEDTMYETIASLYTDFDELKNMSDNGKKLVDAYFNSKVAFEILDQDM